MTTTSRPQPARGAPSWLAAIGVTVSTLALVFGGGEVRADDWTSLGLDTARSRFSTERSGATFKGREWRYTLPAVADPIDRVLVSSPAVADGYVVFGTTTGKVVALGATDGGVRWSFQAREGLHASPAIVRGTVIAPSFDGNIHGLRLADGQPIWTQALGSVTFSSPAPVENSVVIASGFPAQKLVRLDAATGKTLWETPAGAMDQGSNSSVAVAGNQVIVGAMAGTYHSFDLATGAPRWTYTAGGAVHLTTPMVAEGKAFFAPGGSSHSVHAVEVETGQSAAGWPVEISILPPDASGGTVKDRDYATSSMTRAGGLLLFEQRMLELVDADGDGAVDTYLLREETIAVNPGTARIAWRLANGRMLTQDRSAIPAFGVCPTPLVYADPTGRLLAATASTLSNRLRVLDVTTGAEVWSTALSAPTRGSPALANGRLFVATDAGVVHGLLSSHNQPPRFAVSTRRQPSTVPTVGAVVSWQLAVDPDGDAATYELRMDRDGEVLSSWEHQLTLGTGDTSTRLPWTLDGGSTYTYAVRARDTSGAWSEWTAPETVLAIETPAVTVGGIAAPSLTEALAGARPGDVVQLAVGIFRLSETLRLTAGVTLSGAGPQQTILDGSSLDTTVSLRGSASSAPGGLDHLTVTGGRLGVSVADTQSGADTQNATLRNIVVRDTLQVGIDVEKDGVVTVINATVVRAGIALRAAGTANVRNSLMVNNRSGLVALAGGHVASNFNDVHANASNYTNVEAGVADLDQAVTFVNDRTNDFHLKGEQPTTDRGAPGDDWRNEPAPNGGRVNLGAFGNTAEAETSRVAPPAGVSVGTGPTSPSPIQGAVGGAAARNGGVPSPTPVSDVRSSSDGCSVAAAPEPRSGVTPALTVLALIALALVVRGRRRPGRLRVRP